MPSAFAAGKLWSFITTSARMSQVFDRSWRRRSCVTVHHTIDIRSDYAAKGDVPVFGPSIRVSQYLMGSRPG